MLEVQAQLLDAKLAKSSSVVEVDHMKHAIKEFEGKDSLEKKKRREAEEQKRKSNNETAKVHRKLSKVVARSVAMVDKGMEAYKLFKEC